MAEEQRSASKPYLVDFLIGKHHKKLIPKGMENPSFEEISKPDDAVNVYQHVKSLFSPWSQLPLRVNTGCLLAKNVHEV